MRWWLRPKWVFGHVLCLVLIVLFVNLGFWQLRRLDERRDRSELIESRMNGGPSPFEDIAGSTDLRYRRVVAAGRWLADETVLVRSRALEGRPGYHVVTPLETTAAVVFVNRGFVPRAGGDEPRLLADVTPPDERVRIEGILRPTEERGRLGPADGDGDPRIVNRVDVARLARRIDGDDVVPDVFLQQTAPSPPGGVPALLPLPETGDGPHLSYAVQWFIFATVGAVGWPLLLRRTVRDRRGEPSETE